MTNRIATRSSKPISQVDRAARQARMQKLAAGIRQTALALRVAAALEHVGPAMTLAEFNTQLS